MLPTVVSARERTRSPRRFVHKAWMDLARSLRSGAWRAKRNLKGRYRDSSLGLAWVFVPPLFTAVALQLGAGRTHTPLAAPFEGVFGLTMAQFFLDGLFSFCFLFNDSALMRSRPWGLEVAIISRCWEQLFQMSARLLVLAGCFLFFHSPLAWSWPLALPGCLGLSLLGASLGLLLAPLSSLRRDLDHLMQVVPWMLLALTPVFLPWSPTSPLVQIYRYNPVAWIIQSERSLAYGATGVPWLSLATLPCALGLLLGGWLWVRLWKPHLLERNL